MPRITHVPQFDPTDSLYVTRTLQADCLEDAPIIPAQIGGSFCAEVEKFYDNIVLSLSAMNSQQIADAVNQVFLSVDMTAMPPAQRQAYKDGLEGVIKNNIIIRQKPYVPIVKGMIKIVQSSRYINVISR